MVDHEDQVFEELERLGYDCELRRSGVLTIARTPAELAMCRAEYAAPPCSLWRPLALWRSLPVFA